MMDRDNLLVAVSILILIGFQVYSTLSTGDTTAVTLALPLVTLVVFFLIIVFALGKAEQRITSSLDRRLPALEHIREREDVEHELTRLAGTGKEWIIATGGRSRGQDYLEAIERRIETGGGPPLAFVVWRAHIARDVWPPVPDPRFRSCLDRRYS